jgi:hypothetical protein
VVPLGAGAAAGNVVTYRCACGFTIDDPAADAACFNATEFNATEFTSAPFNSDMGDHALAS